MLFVKYCEICPKTCLWSLIWALSTFCSTLVPSYFVIKPLLPQSARLRRSLNLRPIFRPWLQLALASIPLRHDLLGLWDYHGLPWTTPLCLRAFEKPNLKNLEEGNLESPHTLNGSNLCLFCYNFVQHLAPVSCGPLGPQVGELALKSSSCRPAGL